MENLQVTVESGKLQGVHGWDPRVAVFRGIPYAAPPIGELRWRTPLPAVPWEGVRKADQYGPIACQPVPGSNPEEFWTREISARQISIFSSFSAREATKSPR